MWVFFCCLVFRACGLISYAYSSLSELLDRLLKNGKHQWYGAFGRAKRWTILIGNGQKGRQLKLRITFSTGKKLISLFFAFVDAHLLF